MTKVEQPQSKTLDDSTMNTSASTPAIAQQKNRGSRVLKLHNSNEASETTEAETILTLLANSLTDTTQLSMSEAHIKEYVPFPYKITNQGISIQTPETEKKEAKTEHICSPIIVNNLTKGSSGNDYGLQLTAQTLDKKIVEMTLPSSRLHGDPAELARVFENKGVRIVPSKARAFAAYVDAGRNAARKRKWLTAMPRTGWAEGDQMAYIFPDQIIGKTDCVYQPEQFTQISDSCCTEGTINDWKSHIADVCNQSDLCLFIIFASLTAPILRMANSDSFGFNLAGMTSRGKTTALQLASSIWGRASDPGADSRAYVRRWNSTSNALEATAEEHSDLPLCLDELGQFRNGNEIGKAIYALAGGRGTERLKSDSSRRTVREWRTIILSTGEISITELMAQNGQQQKGGQALRIFDIPFPSSGLFPSDPDAGKRVRALKEACGKYFGVAGRRYIKWLIGKFERHNNAAEFIREKRAQIRDTLAKNTPPEISRAADRFALIQIAGEFAVEANLVNCSRAQVERAVSKIWDLWRYSLPDVDDGKRAIHCIAQYIISHPGSFPTNDQSSNLPQQISGYFKESAGLYLFTDDGLKAALSDISKTAAIQSLRENNLLFLNEGNRNKSKHEVAAFKKRTYFYAIRAEILELISELACLDASLHSNESNKTEINGSSSDASPASMSHNNDDFVEF